MRCLKSMEEKLRNLEERERLLQERFEEYALLREEKHLEPLSDEELVISYREEPTPEKEEELFRRFSRLILKIASKYNYRDKEDLYQAGWIGLMKAIRRYEPERANKFLSYAYTLIDGEIKHFLRDRGELIRRPAWIKPILSRILRIVEMRGSVSLDELANSLNISKEGLQEIIKAIIKVDYEPDLSKIRSKRFESFKLPIEDRIFLSQLLERLSEVERRVIYYVFEMDLTQSEIGKLLQVSQRTVSRILRRALGKLRKMSEEDLRDKGGD